MSRVLEYGLLVGIRVVYVRVSHVGIRVFVGIRVGGMYVSCIVILVVDWNMGCAYLCIVC